MFIRITLADGTQRLLNTAFVAEISALNLTGYPDCKSLLTMSMTEELREAGGHVRTAQVIYYAKETPEAIAANLSALGQFKLP